MPRREKTSNEWTVRERLKLFVERAGELRSLAFVQDMQSWEYTITFSAQSGISSELPGHHSEARRAFASLFRQFCMNDEPVNVGRICNDCNLYLSDANLKGRVQSLQKLWNTVLRGKTGGQLTLNGKNLTPEYVLDLWFNGHYAHSDRTKTLELRKLRDLELPIGEFALVYMLPVLVKIVLELGDIISSALKEGLFNVPQGVG